MNNMTVYTNLVSSFHMHFTFKISASYFNVALEEAFLNVKMFLREPRDQGSSLARAKAGSEC